MSLEILANSCMSDSIYFSGNKDLKSFSCPFKNCNRQFSSNRCLMDHYRGHHSSNKPHACSFPGCSKAFLRPAHLLIHTRIHTGEKPFICEFKGCGKRWNQKSALKQHMRCHTGEKPFVCPASTCNKRFSTSSSCKRHFLTHQKRNLTVLRRRMQLIESSSSDEEFNSIEQMGDVKISVFLEDEESLQLSKMAMTFILN